MATALDEKLIPVIFDVVDRFGINATFYQAEIDPEDYDPTTGHTTPDTDPGVVAKVAPPEDYTEGMIDGDLIKHGDTKIYLPSKDLAFTPENGMRVVIGTTEWKAEAIDPIYSGELICLYRIQLRQ